MIYLTRLSGDKFAVNVDLVERAEATPDTVLMLVNGSRYVVRESVDELIDLLRSYRIELLAGAQLAASRPAPPRVRTRRPETAEMAGETVVQLHPESAGS